jgi:hypothetical protein
MLNRLLTVNDIRLQSSSTAVSTFLPFDQNCRRLPTQLVIRATGNGAFVRLSDDRSDATNADLLVQPGDHVVVAVAQRRWVSMLPVTGSTTVSVGALSTGVGRAVASVDPFAQTGPALDLVFAGVPSDLLSPSYTLTTDFVAPQYEIGAQYAIWDDSGLVQKNFADIVTFTRASTATYFNSAGTLTSAAVDEARFDYNPSTLAAQGLLIEEQRTNSIRNNTAQGAVAGTPGTLPTNWALGGISGGLATQIVGAGAEDGIAYIDIRIFGTNSSGSSLFPGVFFDTATGIAGTTGQVWTPSVYLKLAAGTGVTFDLAVHEADSGGVFLRSVSIAGTSGIPTTGALKTQRRSGSVTLGASTAFVRPLIATTVTNGTSVDFTLRIGLPQLELGAFATSVIPTSTTALTRSADVASVNTLSPWFNATAGTLYAEWVARLGVDQQAFGLVDVGDGVRVRKNSSNNYVFVARDPAVRDITLVPSPAITESQIIKVAGAYAINDLALSGGGQSPATGSTYSVVTATTAFIGGNVSAGATYVNGHLRRITYYPRRLSNADLQTITT